MGVIVDFDYYDALDASLRGNRGSLGSATNRQVIDAGTLVLNRSRLRALKLERIATSFRDDKFWFVKPAVELKSGELKQFEKKFEIGKAVYDELGLAGQIAKKFLKLPYRTGRIIRRHHRYELVYNIGHTIGAGGLVCSTFANIFGAIWFAKDHMKFAGDRKKKFAEDYTKIEPVRAWNDSVEAYKRERLPGEGGKKYKIVRKSDGEVLGESDNEEKAIERARLRTAAKVGRKKAGTDNIEKYALSVAQVYASMYDGSLVNTKRLRLDELINELNKDKKRLYAVVKYHSGGLEKTMGHIFFVAYSTTVKDWVTIESTGADMKHGGKGAGPGIYKIPRFTKKKRWSKKHKCWINNPRCHKIKPKEYYQAFDWGLLKPWDPKFNDWEYVT